MYAACRFPGLVSMAAQGPPLQSSSHFRLLNRRSSAHRQMKCFPSENEVYKRTCVHGFYVRFFFASSHRCFRTSSRYVRMYTLCTHVHFCTLLFLFPYKSCAAKTPRAASVSYIRSRYVRMYTSFLVPYTFLFQTREII